MKTEGFFIIKKGKAKDAFELRPFDIDLPESQNVLIEVEAFGLNYADVMARKGLYRDAPPFPSIVGYEVVGKVVAVGDQSNAELLDKRVLAFTRFGGYAKHVLTSAEACVIVQNEPAEELLALCTQGVTAYYMASYLAPTRMGDVVLVHAAAGGVGTLLIQLAKLAGAKVIAKVGSDEKIDRVKQLGADYAVNYRKTDYSVWIKENVGKIDASFNPVGGSTFKKDKSLLRAGGRIFIFGGSELGDGKWGVFSALNFVRKMGLVIPVGLMMTSKNILGVNMLRIADQRPEVLRTCLIGIVEYYRNKQLIIPEGSVYKSTDLATAHELLESGRSMGKISVFW